jgi:hypothetical protein
VSQVELENELPSSWQRKRSVHQPARNLKEKKNLATEMFHTPVCQKFEGKKEAGKGNVACTNLPVIQKKSLATEMFRAPSSQKFEKKKASHH